MTNSITKQKPLQKERVQKSYLYKYSTRRSKVVPAIFYGFTKIGYNRIKHSLGLYDIRLDRRMISVLLDSEPQVATVFVEFTKLLSTYDHSKT